MLISEFVPVRWIGNTASHYLEKGYSFTKWKDYFDCRVEDLMKTSTVKVEVKCDYCKDGISWKPYRDYLKSRKEIAKDCCKKRSCMVEKSKEISVLRYGVESPNQLEDKKMNASKRFRTSKKEVLETSLEKGIKILNIEDYQNDRSRLKVICLNHKEFGEYETNFSNIKSSSHCCRNKKIVSSRKLDGNRVIEEFKEKGLTPLFEAKDYVNNNISLPYLCKRHPDLGVQYKSRANLQYSSRCKECSNESRSSSHRMPYEEVEQLLLSKSMKPLDIYSYKNKDEKLEYTCNFHPEYVQETYIGTLSRVKVPCKYCREENSLLTLSKKMRSTSSTWRKRVEKECEEMCVFTGSKEYDVHHLYSYNMMLEDAMNFHGIDKKNEYNSKEEVLIREFMLEAHKEAQGVCLHPDIHILFHKEYGKNGNNTPEQFQKFNKDIRNGVYYEYLKEKGLEILPERKETRYV